MHLMLRIFIILFQMLFIWNSICNTCQEIFLNFFSLNNFNLLQSLILWGNTFHNNGSLTVNDQM